MGSCENTMKLEALPKGFRFRPTDEELISHYLRLKINGCHSAVDVVPEVDVCKWEPWDLPALSVIKSDDLEWFFFCPRDRKYPNGYRSNRATEAGYWKATGKDRTIKSRKSSPPGCSRSQPIGLKKTLVFYKGRAPKGERTNWIMHEYRATEPDLDGTGPGQGDYVLCRLFHKVDEKLGNSKFNEDEHTGSFPSTNKSSPEDVSSDLLREPALLDMQMIKEPEDIKKLWTDQAGCLTPTNLAPVESYASDANNHSVEETAMEVSRPLREVSMSEEAPYNQFDDRVLGTFQSHSYDDLSAPIASPFAADFGNERNGLHFQDGTSEPDASLSELWEDLQNDVNQFDEGSTGQRTHDKSESFIPSHVDGPEHAPFAICKGQISPSLSRVPSTDHSHSHYPVGEVDSSPVETFCDPNPTEDDSHLVSGTGIKIRSRMPRDRSRSINFAAQGTAPRRMRLWMSYGRERSKGEEHESRSLIRKTTKDIDRTSSEESEFANQNKETAKKCRPTPTKHGQNGGVKMASSMLSAAWPARQGSGYFKAYAVGIYVAIILSVVFLGMWICPRLHALRS